MTPSAGAAFARAACLLALATFLGTSCSSARPPSDSLPDMTDGSVDGTASGGPDALVDGDGRPASIWPAGVTRVRPPASMVAVAATADALAVAYLVRPPAVADAGPDATSDGRLLRQWLDGDLAPLGAAEELDRRPDMGTLVQPAVASNGTDVLVCWSAQDDLRCFLLRKDSPPSLFFATTGAFPTPAAFETGWGLAYQWSTLATDAAEIKVLRLTGEGQALGPTVSFPSDNYFHISVPFVSTPSGFALLAGRKSLSLIRLTRDLEVQGDPVDTKLLPWSFQSLAATDEEAAFGLSVPYGNRLFHVRGQEVVATQSRPCVGKAGCQVAVTWQGRGFAAAWWNTPDELAFAADVDQATVGEHEILGFGPQVLLVPFRGRLVAVTSDPR